MDMEILAVGTWNGIPITRKIMDQMVANFTTFKDLLRVSLKLGHNEEQKITDGHPAIGKLDSIWINEAGVMMGRPVEMPEIVENAIAKHLYTNVSIEASLEVTHKGKNYGAVLTGLALLGADLPAVNTLSDLQAYLTAQNEFTFSRCANFTAIGGTSINKETDMTLEEMEAALAKEKLKNATLEAQSATFKVEQDTKTAALTAEVKTLKDGQAEVQFAADKKGVTDTMELLVKGKHITPGQRDKFAAQVTDAATLANVKMSIEVLSEGIDLSKIDKVDGKVETEDDKEHKGMKPDEMLHVKATKFSREHKVPYGEGVDMVMAEDPKLARDYTDQFDKEVA